MCHSERGSLLQTYCPSGRKPAALFRESTRGVGGEDILTEKLALGMARMNNNNENNHNHKADILKIIATLE